jgi:hypothetical protein
VFDVERGMHSGARLKPQWYQLEGGRLLAGIFDSQRIRAAYAALRLDVELSRRRLLIAKAERIDTTQLELEFAAKLAALDALAGKVAPDDDEPEDDRGAKRRSGTPRKRTGRRDLRALDLPEDRIEITDPVLEGIALRIGAEESTASCARTRSTASIGKHQGLRLAAPAWHRPILGAPGIGWAGMGGHVGRAASVPAAGSPAGWTAASTRSSSAQASAGRSTRRESGIRGMLLRTLRV